MSLTPSPTGKPGKNRPAASAFLIQRPLLRSFTQESLEKQKPSAQQAASALTCRGLYTADSSEPAPSLRSWIFAPRRDPEANGSTLSRSASLPSAEIWPCRYIAQ